MICMNTMSLTITISQVLKFTKTMKKLSLPLVWSHATARTTVCPVVFTRKANIAVSQFLFILRFPLRKQTICLFYCSRRTDVKLVVVFVHPFIEEVWKVWPTRKCPSNFHNRCSLRFTRTTRNLSYVCAYSLRLPAAASYIAQRVHGVDVYQSMTKSR